MKHTCKTRRLLIENVFGQWLARRPPLVVHPQASSPEIVMRMDQVWQPCAFMAFLCTSTYIYVYIYIHILLLLLVPEASFWSSSISTNTISKHTVSSSSPEVKPPTPRVHPATMPFGVCTPHGLGGCDCVTGQNDGEAPGPLQSAGLVKAIGVRRTPGWLLHWRVWGFKPSWKMTKWQNMRKKASGTWKWQVKRKTNEQHHCDYARARRVWGVEETWSVAHLNLPRPLHALFLCHDVILSSIDNAMKFSTVYGKTPKYKCFLLLSFENWKWLKGTKQSYLWVSFCISDQALKISRRDWRTRNPCFAHLLHLTPNITVNAIFLVYQSVYRGAKSLVLALPLLRSIASFVPFHTMPQGCYEDLQKTSRHPHALDTLAHRPQVARALVTRHPFTRWPKISPLECCGTKQIVSSFMFRFYQNLTSYTAFFQVFGHGRQWSRERLLGCSSTALYPLIAAEGTPWHWKSQPASHGRIECNASIPLRYAICHASLQAQVAQHQYFFDWLLFGGFVCMSRVGHLCLS